ncbi:MAG: DUF4097 family beta strand repeat-containing protein [Phycisphaerales bacterium]
MNNLPNVVRVLSAAAVLAAGTLGLAGCIVSTSGCSNSWLPANFKGPVSAAATLTSSTAVDASTANGTVTLVAGTGQQLTVTGTAHATSAERLAQIKVLVEQGADGTARVTVQWPPDGRKSSEGCDLDIVTPAVAKLTAKTSNGSMTSTGLSGELLLDTSNGAITVNGHKGSLNADTSNGAVVVSGADGPVSVKTSNGRVTIAVVSAGEPVNARSSNGTISLTVPAAFTGTISCSTSNGGITNATKGALTPGSSKSRGTIKLGDGAAASTLSTSNGSITVTQGQ